MARRHLVSALAATSILALLLLPFSSNYDIFFLKQFSRSQHVAHSAPDGLTGGEYVLGLGKADITG